MNVNQHPNALLNQILSDLDELVNEKKEETVRHLHKRIAAAIEKAGEELRQYHASALQTSREERHHERADIEL